MSDRKYRQRGYRDDERPRGEVARGPRPEREGPRGRGLGAPTKTVFRCARCGTLARPGAEVGPTAVCPKCDSDLHTCTNCRHFDTSAPGECRVAAAPRVAAKAKRNECSHFEPKATQEFDSGSQPDDPRAAFDALFDF